MSFDREDYKRVYDFAEIILKSCHGRRHALGDEAEHVMNMCEQVIGQQRGSEEHLNRYDHSKQYVQLSAQPKASKQRRRAAYRRAGQ